MFLFSLAELLHKSIDEMGDMTQVEFHAWYAYFRKTGRLVKAGQKK